MCFNSTVNINRQLCVPTLQDKVVEKIKSSIVGQTYSILGQLSKVSVPHVDQPLMNTEVEDLPPFSTNITLEGHCIQLKLEGQTKVTGNTFTLEGICVNRSITGEEYVNIASLFNAAC